MVAGGRKRKKKKRKEDCIEEDRNLMAEVYYFFWILLLSFSMRDKQNLPALLQVIDFQPNDHSRAPTPRNAILSYFTISKTYFINYTILFYNTPNIPKL